MPLTSFNFALLSDPGRVRQQNEDACAADAGLGVFVVCDGVGGAAGGEVASQVAADTLIGEIVAMAADASPERTLQAAIQQANQAVGERARQSPSLRGMATTMVALLFERGEPASSVATVWIVNVGDSRCYRLRQGVLQQLTRDHSLVEEQVRAGQITREQAAGSPFRNVITRALGSELEVEADVHSEPVEPGDLYLLASDGLTRDLEDRQIADLLLNEHLQANPQRENATGKRGTMPIVAMCESLIRAANELGGGDNITCVLVEVQ